MVETISSIETDPTTSHFYWMVRVKIENGKKDLIALYYLICGYTAAINDK